MTALLALAGLLTAAPPTPATPRAEGPASATPAPAERPPPTPASSAATPAPAERPPGAPSSAATPAPAERPPPTPSSSAATPRGARPPGAPAFAAAAVSFAGVVGTGARGGEGRTSFVPGLRARYRWADRWALDAEWAFGALFSPSGVIEEPRSGDTGPDDTPRTGNPFLGARYAWLRAPSGLSVDATLGVALPMASIPKPTPATGPDFERAPHTEETYRRALAVTGFRRPWRFLWHTGSLVASAYVRQETGALVLDVEPSVALLVPAGRLRADPGVALTVRAYAGARLLEALEVGMRADAGYVSPQRDEVDGTLQIEGAQLALAPELLFDPSGPFFARAAVIVNAAVELEPAPEEAVWGGQLEVGAEF